MANPTRLSLSRPSTLSIDSSDRGSTSGTLLAGGLAVLCISSALFAQTPTRVDLRARQTPFRDQGGRRTCTTFCSIAALEAAYKRANYGNLDLSEEFLNYMTKMFWLSNSTPSNTLQRDNQASWGAGGSGPDLLGMLSGTPIPVETAMPYQKFGYAAPNRSNAAFWALQKNVNDWGLDPRNLPRGALRASRYYGVRTFAKTAGNNTASIEAILASGREVVWGFQPNGNIVTHRNYSSTGTKTNPAVWRTSSKRANDSHCMLIVGYDRSRQYFICKNHWAKSGRSADGFSYISYSYLRSYGSTANYITSILTPKSRPELAFIGRYNIAFDGHRGTLDITHMPGAMQWRFNRDGVKQVDRRIGTFFDAKGKAFRVNGSISGRRIVFWFKSTRPAMTFDEQRGTTAGGRRFVYYLANAGLQAEFIDPFTRKRVKFVALVRKSRPAELICRFTHPTRGYVSVRCYMLSWQRGVIAGEVNVGGLNGFLGWRTGSAIQSGSKTKVGTGCRGSKNTLLHTISSAPFLGRHFTVWTTGGPSYATGLWTIGSLHAPVLFPGTTNCYLRVAGASLPIRFDSTGVSKFSLQVPNDSNLVGVRLASQSVSFDRGARAGLTISNAVSLLVGGYR